jgi:CNT family concentrative nucleoside transporter
MILAAFGYITFLLIAFFMRERGSSDSCCRLTSVLSVTAIGILFQIAVVFALTNIPCVISLFESIANGVMQLKAATSEGTKFVFGYLGGGELPFFSKSDVSPFIFAFQALPTVILVGALAAVLTYLNILPILSKTIGWIFKIVFKIPESVGMVSAAKIFLGQLEAPLLIKPHLETMPKQGMFIIISLAFATTSAAVMPIYATMMADICPDAMRHIITSSIVSVISTLVICSLVMPMSNTNAGNAFNERNSLISNGEDSFSEQKPDKNKYYPSLMAALSKGLSDGIRVWVGILGTLIGMVAIIALLNTLLALLPDFQGSSITLQRIFGFILYPVALLMGISSQDAFSVAQLLGAKIALNEMVAFFELTKLSMSEQSVVSSIYAINDFGNISCIGITIGGLMSLVPGRKDIPMLAWKAFVAGFLATGLTTCIMNLSCCLK